MSKERKILLIILFNSLIILSEIVFGLISNSFALIGDALHNTGDVIAIIITYTALRLGSVHTTFKYTFGFIKAEMMAAFVNTLFLFVTMFYLIYEAVNRIFNPEAIEPVYMIVVGLIAVAANGISAYILNNMGIDDHHHHHHHNEDANIRSAYLHMLSDALISVAVVVAGIFIYLFEIYYIDSVLTVLFSLYILNHSYPLLRKSFFSLMDINFTDISKQKLDQLIKLDKRVIEYHDLHIHTPSSKDKYISFHIVLKDDQITLQECENISSDIKNRLNDEGFNHILIQFDTKEHIKDSINCVNN
jgi:cobalt-zinc-cadmium efflux system protein